MKSISTLLAIGVLCSTASMADPSPAYHLMAGFEFTAPIVNNVSNYTNQLPYGSIVYDASVDQFKGLNRDGNWDTMTIAGSTPNVTSTSTGQLHIEAAYFTMSGSTCTVSSQSGSWVATGAGSTGVCNLTLTSGEFSAAPWCTVTPNAGAGAVFSGVNVASNTAATVYLENASGTAYSANFYLICMGSK